MDQHSLDMRIRKSDHSVPQRLFVITTIALGRLGRVRDLAKGACGAWMEKNGWAA